MNKDQTNNTFRIFSAICIILVVAGHEDFHIFDFGGMFPYYSFHVMAFLFISGYFYQETSEGNFLFYIKRKFLRLMLPYFLWNLFYGLLASALHRIGFSIGDGLSFKTLFLDPFLGGHQFGYHFASWFVPALFLIEVLNVCMRKILALLRLKKEWLILFATLATGMLTVWFAIGGHVWGYYKLPGRILFMFPVYQLGILYKKKLERYDTLPSKYYFALLFILQLAIVLNNGGLAYSAVWCTSFVNGPAIPYLTTITGIAFWLRVSRLLTPLSGQLKGLTFLGASTYAVMMHHILGFMLLKAILYGLSPFLTSLSTFDRAAFLSDIGYIYLPNSSDAFKWVYLAAGIGFSLLMQHITGKIARQTKRNHPYSHC
ncbi:acyltransferase [Lachnospiraceae bacterium]|nr:acyltransferase [Lachnospiraceae bacterium]